MSEEGFISYMFILMIINVIFGILTEESLLKTAIINIFIMILTISSIIVNRKHFAKSQNQEENHATEQDKLHINYLNSEESEQ